MRLLLLLCGLAIVTGSSLLVGMFSAIKHIFSKSFPPKEVDEVVSKHVAIYLAIWLLGVVLVLVSR